MAVIKVGLDQRRFLPVPVQFTLGPEEKRILVRPVSWLGDIRQDSAFGPKNQRALLTHYQDAFGMVFQHEIDELEELLSNRSSTERDFQIFFEKHKQFFGFWNFKEIHPQVYLYRRDEGSLVPDFILTDPELQKSLIVELKRTTPKIVRNHLNRERFATAVFEARAQLLTYKEFFRSKANRDLLSRQLGMDVYEPALAVIIGRSSDFGNEIERQRYQSHMSDIEIVTYDDILIHARRRRILIQPSLVE